MSLEPGRRIGTYEVTGLLGEGGMGEVYRARDTKLDRDVALKVLPQAFTEDPNRLTRFEREAKVLASLNHPNICTVHDIGEHEGRPFIVMEVVQGETLQQLLSTGPLQPRRAIDFGMQLADALDAAHAEGVIHRDIKPANIIVNDRGHTKLLDFGLAKLTPRGDLDTASDDQLAAPTVEAVELTQPRSAIGTVAYMSPEQARGEELDTRTDLFSLGAVLYEMVTGQRAFAGPSTAVVFDAILNRDPPPAASVVMGMPGRLAEIISNALEKDPELRYQAAADLLADLKRAKRDLDSGQSATASTMATSGGPLPAGQASDRAQSVGAGAGAAELAQPMPRARGRWVAVTLGGGALALLIAFFAGPWRPVPEVDTDDRVAALVQSQLTLATDSLSRSDFESAIAYADAALTVAPNETEALRIRAAAAAALARGASEPSAALEPLAADPPEVADPSPRIVPSPPPPPPQPRRPAPLPEDLRPAPPPAETTTVPAPAPAPATPALEPTIGDDRVAEVAEVDEATPPTQAETEPPLANAVDDGEPETSTLASEADVPPTPVNAPGSQSDVPGSQREDTAIREVLATLERAIETMDMTLYRSVRPTLSGDEARRVRAGFDAVQSQQVDLRILSIEIQGDQAVVRVTRRDTIQTAGGEQTQESSQTVTLAKRTEGWVITQMGG